MESAPSNPNDKESMVDPFLVEALQNPRHRLTILRMELDVEKFIQNPELQQFEFQQFPTSYIRLAAHRVAQHYGLITMVQDGGIRILARKTADTRSPAVRLSEIPAKQSENDKLENMTNVAIRRRPNKGYGSDSNGKEAKGNFMRSVEERKEEYDKARARIFSGPSSPVSDDSLSVDGKNTFDENEMWKNLPVDPTSSRVAIFRDREKDRVDPDYDRSYERYIRNLPGNQNINFGPMSMQQPFVQYQMPASYRPPGIPDYCAMGMVRDTSYMHWPAAMMYAHPYDQFRHAAAVQVHPSPSFCQQQPLSFDYSHYH